MENISKDAALPNQFSGVIKKIKKLYMVIYFYTASWFISF